MNMRGLTLATIDPNINAFRHKPADPSYSLAGGALTQPNANLMREIRTTQGGFRNIQRDFKDILSKNSLKFT